MYTHTSSEKIRENFLQVGTHIKKAQVLSGQWGAEYTVATIVIDDSQPPAEVHENFADVWIVVTGTAIFTLGGTMVEETKASEGEWIAEHIEGGEQCVAHPGDVVDIPPGVPHQVDTRNGRAEFLILKVKVQKQ